MSKYFLLLYFLLFTSMANAIDVIDKLARLPDFSQIQLSPDGQKIAYLQTLDDKFYIVTKHLDSNVKFKPRVFALSNAIIRNFQWLSDNRILFQASFTKYSKGDQERFTFLRAGILDTEENTAIWPFSSERFLYNLGAPVLINTLPKEPDYILMSNYYSSVSLGTIAKLYKINITNGDKDEFFYERRNNGWKTNDEGEVILVRKYDPKSENSYWYKKNNKTGEYEILTTKENDNITNYQKTRVSYFDSQNNYLYFFEDDKDGYHTLYKSAIKNGFVENAITVAKDEKYDILSGVFDYHTSTLLGVRFTKNFVKTEYFFDNTLAKTQADLEATFPNTSIYITSYNKAKNKFIARVTGPNNPEEFFIYDQKLGRLDKIIAGYSVEKQYLGTTKVFTYTTQDKFNIDGYLALPKKANDELPPLIVMPHGGPESRDNLNFDWLRASFIAKGYAVYQPNFRGSSGYGTKFTEAGYGQWGQKMQFDIDEGVMAVLKTGAIDTERVCIVGASYGGYAAMIAATRKPEVYKCAVSFGGVSDLDDMFYHDQEQLGDNSYWEKSIGERKDQKLLANNSPKNLVSEKTSPILLLHGNMDTVVPTFQSKNMYKELKKFNIKGSDYIEIDDADHWFSSTKSRKVFVKESIEFLEAHL